MKRLMLSLLSLPFLTSCIAQGTYYEPGYYPPPPPPHVEVHRYNGHYHRYHRPAPGVRVKQHGRSNNHENNHSGGHAVVVNPHQSQAHGSVHGNTPGSGGKVTARKNVEEHN